MSHTPSVHYLHRYQAALAPLPEDTVVFVIQGTGELPNEVFAVFLDRAGANLWIASQKFGSPSDFVVLPFTLFRKIGSQLAYLRPGEPDRDDPQLQNMLARIRRTHPPLVGLTRDTA